MKEEPKKEKKITVIEATEIAFSRMAVEFHVIDLVNEVRSITERPHLMDGTVTRDLRDLKVLGKINYEVIDHNKARYKKIPKGAIQLVLF